MVQSILAVAKKEALDALRDKRAVFASFAYALFGPLVLLLSLNAVARDVSDETAPKVAIVGGAPAPVLVQAMGRARMERVTAAEADLLVAKAALEQGTIDAILEVPSDAPAQLAAGRPVLVTLHADYAKKTTPRRVVTLQNELRGVLASFGVARLFARGIDPSIAEAVYLDVANTSSVSSEARTVAAMLATFLLLAPFFSSMNTAIDLTAGERERESLEVLLAQPIAPGAIVVGKWLVAVGMGACGTVLTLIVGFAALKGAPLAELGVRFDLSLSAGLLALTVLLPLVAFASALQMLVALAAKNYKEAQSYLTLLSLAPAALTMMRSFQGTRTSVAPWVPILAQHAIVDDIINAVAVNAGGLIVAATACFAITAACLAGCARALRRERMLSVA